MNSFNHYALGSVGEWLYEYVAGIQLDPERPGYEHVLIAPEPGALEWARATYVSVRGPITSAWRQDGRTFQLDVEIPANVTATCHPPRTAGDTRSAPGAGASPPRGASERELVRARPGAQV